MFTRRRELQDKVMVSLDGRELPAERGEPLAAAFLAAGEKILARSPKLHRPRGAACFRGDCDGCIARVDGVPNVMLCRRRCTGGETVLAQNVLGSRQRDLMRLTDWFFPNGIDHHHLLAGIPGAGSVMQTFARQMAGIGRLPDQVEAAKACTQSEVQVLVLGGGLAGAAVTAELLSRGLSVKVLDEGGQLAEFPGSIESLRTTTQELCDRVAPHHLRGTAVGVFDDTVLVDVHTATGSSSGAELIRASALVFATGAHDGVLCTEGNDLPGVMSSRAAVRLASFGVVADGPVVIVGGGPWSDALRAELGKQSIRQISEEELDAVLGSSEVKGVRLKHGETLDAVLVCVELAASPSFELGAQAGAATKRCPGGFAIDVDADGRARLSEDAHFHYPNGLWALGECTGSPFDDELIRQQAGRLARALAATFKGTP
jgi:sarcosine oxidase subunit alpha